MLHFDRSTIKFNFQYTPCLTFYSINLYIKFQIILNYILKYISDNNKFNFQYTPRNLV
jgi:hypothetical protein